MTPILASGAASLAGVLVNRLSGASSSASSGNVALDPKAFERSLNRASGRERETSQAHADALRKKLLQTPEIEAAVLGLPPGSVSSLSIQADGTVHLQTDRGPVAVRLSDQARAAAQSLYAATAVAGPAGPAGMGGAPNAPVQISVQGAALR